MTDRGLQTDAHGDHRAVSFTAWAADVADTCTLVERLQLLAAELGLDDPAGSDWHGVLFGKLRPQVDRDPVRRSAAVPTPARA